MLFVMLRTMRPFHSKLNCEFNLKKALRNILCQLFALSDLDPSATRQAAAFLRPLFVA